MGGRHSRLPTAMDELFVIASGLQQLGGFGGGLIQRGLDFLFVGHGLQDVSCYDGAYIEKVRHRGKWFSDLEGCTGGRIPAIFPGEFRIIKHGGMANSAPFCMLF